MLIDDLSTAYCQSRPLHKQTSVSSIMIRQNENLLVPFQSSCPKCNQSLDASDAIQRRVRLYCQNGSVVTVIIYPNFSRINQRNIYTHQSLHHGKYVYLGGDVAIERSIIDKYTAQIIHHDFSMIGTAASLNQEAFNLGYYQFALIERRLLSNIIHAYLIIQLDLSMGYACVSTPCSLKDFSQWAWEQFPRLLTCFIYLWTNHRTLIGSCGEHCSKCLIVDGHQKVRRRICAFKDVKVETEEIKELVIGCCRTPLRRSRFCQLHNQETMFRGLYLQKISIEQGDTVPAAELEAILRMAYNVRTLDLGIKSSILLHTILHNHDNLGTRINQQLFKFNIKMKLLL
ncbi:unnamed protein product [Rotaria sp. Silwood1]|nr:unnamed protein product [Rotaria sp. Silwood1]